MSKNLDIAQGVFYPDNKPTAEDVGALPVTGGTLTGGVVVRGVVSGTHGVFRHDTSLAGFHIGSNASYGEIVPIHARTASPDWNNGLRNYGTNDWRIGGNRIYHEGRKPTPSDVNAIQFSSLGGLPAGAVGNFSNVPNRPKAGGYQRAYTGYSGNVFVTPNVGGSSMVIAYEMDYNGNFYMHVNTDGNRWNSHQVYTSGRKPTTRDVVTGVTRKDGTEQTLLDVIAELRNEIAELKAKVDI